MRLRADDSVNRIRDFGPASGFDIDFLRCSFRPLIPVTISRGRNAISENRVFTLARPTTPSGANPHPAPSTRTDILIDAFYLFMPKPYFEIIALVANNPHLLTRAEQLRNIRFNGISCNVRSRKQPKRTGFPVTTSDVTVQCVKFHSRIIPLTSAIKCFRQVSRRISNLSRDRNECIPQTISIH